MPAPSTSRVRLLTAEQWLVRRAAHQDRVDGWIAGHRDRAGRGQQHPVEDFLFTYYSHRPGRLRRWSPGPGVVLESHPVTPPYVADPLGAVLGPVPPAVHRTASFVVKLLSATASRPAFLGCFGIHEWAMVYGGGQRHERLPLRLSQQATDDVVRSQRVQCSHFDAFRFFTPTARSLNVLQPTRESQHEVEQPGCLHANMDLYKWCFKLSPYVPAELVADCFDLARRVRVLDMEASPYDVSSLGLSMVAVESAAGRAEYVERQRAFAFEADDLRARVLAAAQALVSSSSTVGQPPVPQDHATFPAGG